MCKNVKKNKILTSGGIEKLLKSFKIPFVYFMRFLYICGVF